ncbi:cysteine/serine-rich nuclear protein 1-like [Genypterus blacodes]|uniref:cysteine/serine-rich nuclear protein 1-like n=1 Tax=Genypterus blacodes TaxID=154954 RepID=UPI003F75C83B
MREVLKRKFTEVDEDPCYSSSSPLSSLSSPSSSEWGSDGESNSSESRDFTPRCPAAPASPPIRSILKRPKSTNEPCSVRFDLVTVFCFPRCQGFTSVPSRGGATLGMGWRHIALQRYTVAEHALEQRHRHRERLKDRLRDEKFLLLKHKLMVSGAIDQREADLLTVDQVQDDVQVSDSELDDGGFLQPYSSKQRQALLQAAGVKRIDKEEKRQLHALRLSREACGCDCQGFCEPETCTCSLAGIKCQVDRFNFPCGCSKDGCGNTQGRFEFDSRRVRTHHIHTIMRLKLESRLQDETLSQADQIGLPEDLEEYGANVQPAQGPSCPFGFTMEDDGLPLTIPSTPSFHFGLERSVVEESSCSSDMTESSCSSGHSEDSDAGGCNLSNSQNLPEVDDGGLSRALNISDMENNDYICSQSKHVRKPLNQHNNNNTYSPSADSVGSLSNTANTFTDYTSVGEYLDENANQTTDFLCDNCLEVLPNTPSPSVDYSSSQYMDLSLSSDSDLEFFDSDYGCGPLHSSFKGHRHPDSVQHFQLFSTATLPQCNESSTYLLESLIGLSEPSPEQVYPIADNQST